MSKYSDSESYRLMTPRTKNLVSTRKRPHPSQPEIFTNISDLCQFLGIQPAQIQAMELASKKFPIRVPMSYAARIKKNDANDPLLLQILPSLEETKLWPGYSDNPVGDLAAIATPGVIHKYHGRVLLIVTGHCAIHCRYCFRKAFPYNEQHLGRQKLTTALHYIASNLDLSEVILSGGDPLSLSDSRLAEIFSGLNQIKHIRRIRIHTRLPIVLPSRITEQLLRVFAASNKSLIIVVHCNHSNEIDQSVINTCRNLAAQPNITLLNQSVLLKGVNDSVEQLCQLSEALFNASILPYYLHLLDKVTGTQHFDVDHRTAVELIAGVKNRLSGYLVPKLVKEEAGALAKTTIT